MDRQEAIDAVGGKVASFRTPTGDARFLLISVDRVRDPLVKGFLRPTEWGPQRDFLDCMVWNEKKHEENFYLDAQVVPEVEKWLRGEFLYRDHVCELTFLDPDEIEAFCGRFGVRFVDRMLDYCDGMFHEGPEFFSSEALPRGVTIREDLS